MTAALHSLVWQILHFSRWSVPALPIRQDLLTSCPSLELSPFVAARSGGGAACLRLPREDSLCRAWRGQKDGAPSSSEARGLQDACTTVPSARPAVGPVREGDRGAGARSARQGVVALRHLNLSATRGGRRATGRAETWARVCWAVPVPRCTKACSAALTRSSC